MTRQVYNSADMLSVLEEALEKNKKPLYAVAEKAGLSSSILPLIRKRGGNMNTDTMFALAKVLGLTVHFEAKKSKKAAPAKPASVIEDIKVVQNWGWQTPTGGGPRIWVPMDWKILILRDGQWHPVRVDHSNPLPPKE